MKIEIARRITVGDYVVDEEHLSNLGDPPAAGEIHASSPTASPVV